MSNEQNIDDILKLLKDSVSDEQTGDISYEQSDAEHQGITTEALQQKLKNQYFESSSVSADNIEKSGEYVIDNDFLAEVETEPEEGNSTDLDANVVEDSVEDTATADIGEPSLEMPSHVSESEAVFAKHSDEPVAILVEDEEPSEDIESEKTLDLDSEPDTVESAAQDLELPWDDDEDEFAAGDIPEDNVDKLISELKPIENEPVYSSEDEVEQEPDEAFVPAEENEYMRDVGDTVADESEEDAFDELEQIYADSSTDIESEQDQLYEDEAADTDEEQIIELEKEDMPHETFLASMRRTGIDFTTEDIYKSTVEVAQTEEDTPAQSTNDVNAEDAPEQSVSDEDIDLSTINLMMQFCEKDELEEKIGDKKVEDFLRYENTTIEHTPTTPAYKGKEYVDFGQNEEISHSYKTSHMHALLSMLGCVCVALIAFVYELMPLLDIRMVGVFNYHDYPAVYALIGLQFIVFAAAICYRPLWQGLKRAFSLTPDRHSIIAILLVLTALYDLIIVMILAFTGDELPPLFNALAAVIVTLSATADYAKVLSEMKAFDIYSSSAQKYTLVKETGKGTVAEKMYSGGLEKDKNVYSINAVDFPNGFFRSVGTKENKNKLLNISLIPAVILGVIAMVVSILIGSDAYASCVAFMFCMYAVLPIALIFSDSIPYAITAIKLSKRGSAVAGAVAAEKYCDCDIMVFDDLHMFKKCKTEDVGIAIYDSSVGYLVLGCLDALYSRIGGPLSGMQMNLPEVFKFRDVAIKRITKNGIEAVIDRKHSLIVGEPEFMQRYGLVFPANEQETDRSTLCVSLGGKVTAKLSVKYEVEPVFEMLVERLYSEGISCAIQTYDPLINSAMLSASRTIGDAPISVVHKSTEDFYGKKQTAYRDEADGVIACSSRLKLAEVEVRLKKLAKVKNICERVAIGFSSVGVLALVLLVAFGVTGYVNQLYLFLYLVLELVAILCITFAMLPSRKYFTTEALYFELERKHERLMRKEQKAENKSNILRKKTNE